MGTYTNKNAYTNRTLTSYTNSSYKNHYQSVNSTKMKMRVNNIFTNLIGFMVVLFSGFFTKLVSAQEENNDDEEYTEPSGDGSVEDPNNVNPLDDDFDMTKWLIIGGSVAAVVIGVIVILAIKKNSRKY